MNRRPLYVIGQGSPRRGLKLLGYPLDVINAANDTMLPTWADPDGRIVWRTLTYAHEGGYTERSAPLVSSIVCRAALPVVAAEFE